MNISELEVGDTVEIFDWQGNLVKEYEITGVLPLTLKNKGANKDENH